MIPRFCAVITTLVICHLTASPSLGEEVAAKEASAGDASPAEIKSDNKRGVLTLNAGAGNYDERNHFAYWNWDFEAQRPGAYEVRLVYTSVRQKKMGIQFRLDGANILKAYVYRSAKPDASDEFVLGRAQISTKGKHHISLLTADKSQAPPFSIKALKLVPIQESEEKLGQGLDGAIELHARDAVTHSEKMQYEIKPEKDCLGYWIHPEDWAEWDFHVSMPGKFKVSLVHGCGDQSGGSEVALLTSGDQVLKFTVKETGGFQKWETLELGTVELGEEGAHKVVIQPLTKPGKAVMDIRKVVLTPVK
ncbi:MAG: hypothetical protein GXP30_12835 [Verrucomicrobia bacterium]|nr:hypothetical protein [Verrucomicrobiota bacterium]